MSLNPKQQALLRKLPGVDHLLEMARADDFFSQIPNSVVLGSARAVVEGLRRQILNGREPDEASLLAERLLARLKARVRQAMAPNLAPVVNATGVVVHTNLGRSLLPRAALENLALISDRYSNLEFDLSTGKRGIRYSCVEELLCEISGAPAAMAVNNNAGAVLLALDTLAKGKEVIVSRGELVEIGGSFRIPDVMAKSGGVLREVGTSNRTHLKDYAQAIGPETGLLLKVHKSNYSIVGFTKEVSLKELVHLGREHHIPVMEDLGSGMFVDFSQYGLIKEPTVQDSVAAGPDLVTFSGDKLLGGPQAGIILGKTSVLETIRKNPLTRALRIDKLTLAALESVLRLYRDPQTALSAIPTLAMITCPLSEVQRKADHLVALLRALDDRRLEIEVLEISSRVGGGALPMQTLPSQGIGLGIQGLSANAVEKQMREHCPPVIGRIENERFVMDLRTVKADELAIIAEHTEDILKS